MALSSAVPTPGTLYLVPNTLDLGTLEGGTTPDVQDVLPLGALRIAARLTYWIAENAKATRSLLKRVNDVVALAQPIQDLQIVEMPRLPKDGTRSAADLRALLTPALAGFDIGLVSDAGLAAVADPGADVVAAAHAHAVAVRALSGPSALMLALAASGLNGQSFAFVGYLPVPAAARAARLQRLEATARHERQTQLFIETPYRNAALLGTILTCLKPDTRLSISCGLTLVGGWTRTDTISDWRARPVSMPDRIPAVFSLLAG